MTTDELLRAIKSLILPYINNNYDDIMFDDEYSVGLRHGRTELANKIYEILKREMK